MVVISGTTARSPILYGQKEDMFVASANWTTSSTGYSHPPAFGFLKNSNKLLTSFQLFSSTYTRGRRKLIPNGIVVVFDISVTSYGNKSLVRLEKCPKEQ